MSGKYNRVGSKKGPLVIGGALSKFDQDSSFVYVPMFRVAGPKSEVMEWLEENHPEQTKTAMKGCYSKTTLKTASVREAFDREVETAARQRQEFTQYKNDMRQVDLRVLVNILQIYDKMKREDPSSVVIASRSGGRSMKDRLAETIGENKFLDVSSMKEKGTESKRVELKKGSMKRHLSQNKEDDLYRVVYNPTSKSSVKGVENFLRNYGGFSSSQISEIKQAISNGNVVNLSKTKSPTRSPILSPKRVGKRSKAVEAERDDDLEQLMDELPIGM